MQRDEDHDVDLVRRAQRGEHEAFDELVGRHGPELYRLAVAVIGPVAAADVTQDALIRAWRELPTLRDPARFLPWVRRILVNRARDVARTQRRGVRELRLEAFDDGAGLPPIPDAAGRLDASADLHAALERLTVDERSLLALHYAMGLSLREVGETLGIPVGTVKSRVNASLAMLRRALEDDGR